VLKADGIPVASTDILKKKHWWKVCSLGAKSGRCLSLVFQSHVAMQLSNNSYHESGPRCYHLAPMAVT